MSKQNGYLDYAAATPMSEAVLAAMQPYFTAKFYNPSAQYLSAKHVATDILAARQKVARLLGAKTDEIVFTAGGTEANNLAINGVMQAHPGANMLISSIEHESVREPAHKYPYKEIVVDESGRLTLDDLAKKIDDKTVLVSIIYANNEIGTVEPIREIAQKLEDIRKARSKKGNKLPLYLHTDAAQAGNYLDMHVSRLGVDLMTLNGGKIYGPKQSGALYVRAGAELAPQILGGGQEHGWRSGTENVAAIVGFATALEEAQKLKTTEVKRLQNLQRQFMKELAQAIPDVTFNGSHKYRLPNNVHITIPGQDNERLMMGLDEQGVQAATGSACSASKEESSHVLHAIGLADDEARASLRFTMGRETTKRSISIAVRTLAKILS